MIKEFELVAPIVAKQRPRATMIGGHARVYPAKETIYYENLIRIAYKDQCDNYSFGDKNVFVRIIALYKKPNEIAKLGELTDGMPKPSKPDIDNIAKSVLDGLSCAWKDDSQVIECNIYKQYYDGDEDKICVTILEDDRLSFDELKIVAKVRKIMNKMFRGKKLTNLETIFYEEHKDLEKKYAEQNYTHRKDYREINGL